MNLKKLIILSPLIFLGGCTIPFLPSSKAALQVSSSPNAQVFLNGESKGSTTFFDDTLSPGEYSLKLAVDNDPQKSFETKINLKPQLVTVVSRNFGTTPETSSAYILELDPLESKNAIELGVITSPENVIVKLNGQAEGFSPVNVTDIEEGDHSIILSAPGYQDLSLKASVKKGYKLKVTAFLAKSPEIEQLVQEVSPATPSALLTTPVATPSGKLSPTPIPTRKSTLSPTKAASSSANTTPLAKPYITVKDTPTGWLRVRSAPDANVENEVARIYPKETYKFLESNASGWYKIEYEAGAQGWVSATYSELTR